MTMYISLLSSHENSPSIWSIHEPTILLHNLSTQTVYLLDKTGVAIVLILVMMFHSMGITMVAE